MDETGLKASIEGFNANPSWQLLNMRITSVAQGAADDGTDVIDVSVVFPAQENSLVRTGSVHGGLIAALADSAVAATVGMTTGNPVATVQLNVNFLAVGKPGLLTANSHIRNLGKTIAFVDCDVRDAEARTVATATAVVRRFAART